ncbi:MAG: NADP oxidoreductase, partial [Candidatus Thermofonsia Clade 1 bacterium]
TNPELKELGELADAEVVVSPEEAMLDPLSAEWLDKSGDSMAQKNVRLLQEYAARGRQGKRRQIYMHFLVSPVELIGTERVEAIRLVRNVLQPASDGSLRPKPTDETFTIPVGLVFR